MMKFALLIVSISLVYACTLKKSSECTGTAPAGFGFSDFSFVLRSVASTGVAGSVRLDGHGFTARCGSSGCAACAATSASGSSCDPSTYAVALQGGGYACIEFGDGLTLPNADFAGPSSMATLPDTHLTVTINDVEVTYQKGAIATADEGKTLRALLLLKSAQAVFFSECGPFIVEDGTERKRAQSPSGSSLGAAPLVPASVSGDPHLKGLFNIEFDVYGKPAADYNLLSAPAFQINTQLAAVGPEMRFMSAMTILFRNTSVTLDVWSIKTRPAELTKHFESLGAKAAVVDGWRLRVWPCDGHEITITSMHTRPVYNGTSLNYLDLAVRVPGCHDAYGGLLGQTYQCKYATEKFEWSRDNEEAFRLPTITTPSGAYTGEADCAREDDYRGSPMSGSIQADGATVKMTLGSR